MDGFNIAESLSVNNRFWNDKLDNIIREMEEIPGTFYAFFWLYNHDFIYVSPQISDILGHSYQKFQKHGLVYFQTIIPPRLISGIYDSMNRQASLIEQSSSSILSNRLIETEAAVYNVFKQEVPVKYQAIILDTRPFEPTSYLLFCSWIDVRNLTSGELSEKTVDVGHYLRKLKELYIDANAEKFRLLKKHLTLSQREKEIANLLATGLSTKQIGERLHISFYTVESHRKNLLQKLEAKNTAELIHRMNRILVQMEISA